MVLSRLFIILIIFCCSPAIYRYTGELHDYVVGEVLVKLAMKTFSCFSS